MKLLLASVLIVGLTGCTTGNEFGPCIGINDQERPSLQYNYSAWNIALGTIFSETIVIPLVVVLLTLSALLQPDNFIPFLTVLSWIAGGLVLVLLVLMFIFNRID